METTSKLKELTIYHNNRAHATFYDSTSLILHSNPKCLTYFSSQGTKSRLNTNKLPENDNIKEKFEILSKVNKIITSTKIEFQ